MHVARYGHSFSQDVPLTMLIFFLATLQALTAMRQLHSEGAVLRELIDQFEAAEAWLAPMRP